MKTGKKEEAKDQGQENAPSGKGTGLEKVMDYLKKRIPSTVDRNKSKDR